MNTKYGYHSLVDGFSQNINLQGERKLIQRFETDILCRINQRKDRQLSVSEYTANFSPTEKRCFLGLLKRFEHVKIIYHFETGMPRQYLVAI